MNDTRVITSIINVIINHINPTDRVRARSQLKPYVYRFVKQGIRQHMPHDRFSETLVRFLTDAIRELTGMTLRQVQYMFKNGQPLNEKIFSILYTTNNLTTHDALSLYGQQPTTTTTDNSSASTLEIYVTDSSSSSSTNSSSNGSNSVTEEEDIEPFTFAISNPDEPGVENTLMRMTKKGPVKLGNIPKTKEGNALWRYLTSLPSGKIDKFGNPIFLNNGDSVVIIAGDYPSEHLRAVSRTRKEAPPCYKQRRPPSYKSKDSSGGRRRLKGKSPVSINSSSSGLPSNSSGSGSSGSSNGNGNGDGRRRGVRRNNGNRVRRRVGLN